jgi:RHS-family protein
LCKITNKILHITYVQDVTHKLGDWAIENGYDGILAPSARNATGTNLIGFNGL